MAVSTKRLSPNQLRNSTGEKLTMKKLLLVFLLCTALATGCGKSETTSTNANSSARPNASDPKASPGSTSGATHKFPAADFPAMATTAKAGDFVLAPEFEVITGASTKGIEAVFGEFYQHTMETPGPEASSVKFSNNKVNQAPNPFLIAIAAGQTAKKGDIVLGYMAPWGMQRGIVIDDADPTKPKVAMLDHDYEDPPSKLEIQLQPNTFVKVSGDFAPGASFYVTGSNTLDTVYTVVNTSGEKVFARTGNGYFKVFDKKDCKPMPFVVSVKAGDKIRGEFSPALSPGTVTKVDTKIGRVWATSDNAGPNPTPKALGYGHLLKN